MAVPVPEVTWPERNADKRTMLEGKIAELDREQLAISLARRP